jgi:hypothetical protein
MRRLEKIAKNEYRVDNMRFVSIDTTDLRHGAISVVVIYRLNGRDYTVKIWTGFPG